MNFPTEIIGPSLTGTDVPPLIGGLSRLMFALVGIVMDPRSNTTYHPRDTNRSRILAIAALLMTSLVTTSLFSNVSGVRANGYTPDALCAGRIEPSEPETASTLRVITSDETTRNTVSGSALFAVRADAAVPLAIDPPGRQLSSCVEASQFDMSSFESGTPFQIGIISPEGFASQWFPSGDRARATSFRKGSNGVIEARTFNGNSWNAVTSIEALLKRGNSLGFTISRAGSSTPQTIGFYTSCLAIWTILPSSTSLEYGGAFCNDDLSDIGSIGLRGIPLNSTFILQLQNSPMATLNPRGFLKWDVSLNKWILTQTSVEATQFKSLGDGGGIEVRGAVTNGESFDIPATRSISGSIEDADGSPVNNVCVYVLQKSTVFAGGNTSDGTVCNLTSGNWQVSGLTGSEYLVYVNDIGDGIIGGFYAPDQTLHPDPARAASITFSSNSASAGNAVAQRGFLVSGSFSRPSGSFDVCVSAWSEGTRAGTREYVNGTCTRSGNFTLNVRAGTYRFEYSERNGLLKSTWNGGATSFANAEDVYVTGAYSLPTISLSEGVTVSGDLDLAGSGEFKSICISAFSADGSDYDWGEWLAGTCAVGSSGGFTLGGLTPGVDVKIRIDSSNGVNRSAFFSNSGPVYKNSQAEVITLSSNLSLPSLTLASGVSITGVVTDGSNNPVQFACVSAISSSWEWLGGTCSDREGRYNLSGLPGDAAMKVWVQSPQSSPTLGGGWLIGPVGTWSVTNSAQSIDVSGNLGNVDVALRSARVISGSVTTSASVDPPPTCVSAFISTSFQWAGRSCTNRQNVYSIGGLPEDQSYVLLVEPQASTGYRSGWLQSSGSGVTTSASGSLRTVSSFSGSSANQDIELLTPPSGVIVGLAELNTKALTGIVVMVKENGASATSSAIAVTVTGAGGNFTLGGLDPGLTYDVYFVDSQTPRRISPSVVAGRSPSATLWRPTLTGVAP